MQLVPFNVQLLVLLQAIALILQVQLLVVLEVAHVLVVVFGLLHLLDPI